MAECFDDQKSPRVFIRPAGHWLVVMLVDISSRQLLNLLTGPTRQYNHSTQFFSRSRLHLQLAVAMKNRDMTGVVA